MKQPFRIRLGEMTAWGKTSLTLFLVSIFMLFCTNLYTTNIETHENNNLNLGVGVISFAAPKSGSASKFKANEFYAKREAKNIYKSELFLEDIRDINLKSGTFNASGKLNIISSSNVQSKQFIHSFHFVNSLNENELITSQVVDSNPDGIQIKKINFSGSFRFSPDLRTFPFDSQVLEIQIESSEASADVIRIKPFRLALSDQISNRGVEGYFVNKPKLSEQIVLYKSELARKSTTGSDTPKLYSDRAIYQVNLSNGFFSGLATYFIPFIVVIAINCLSLALPTICWEVKLVMPPTTLLTLVFMQSSYKDKLIQGSYPSIIDIIYICGYIFCLVTLCISINSTKEYAYGKQKITDKEDGLNIRKNVRSSLKFSLLFFATIVIIASSQIVLNTEAPTVSFDLNDLPSFSQKQQSNELIVKSKKNQLQLKTINQAYSSYNENNAYEKKAFDLLDNFYKLSSSGDINLATKSCDAKMPECGDTEFFAKIRSAGIYKLLTTKNQNDGLLHVEAIVLFQLADGSNSLEVKSFIINLKSNKIMNSKFIRTASTDIIKSNEELVFIPDPPSNIRISESGAVICTIKKRGEFIKIIKSIGQNGWLVTNYCGREGFIHASQVY